jgi:transcriptional regulator with XRE-family HTH domain
MESKEITIGKVLRTFRLSEDLTIKELSEKLGVSTAYISKLESNKSSPTYQMLQKYADYFKVKVSEIVYWTESSDDGERNIKRFTFSFLEKKKKHIKS